jgi:thiol-disulfide isomerase/thioredoxin
MNRLLLTIFALMTSSILFSQSFTGNRCPYKGIQVTDSRILKQADDFTITTTDGITRNLYNTLDSGKTVFVDLFYTTCSWCQFYSPIIEEIYQNTGAGLEDIEFWGISNSLFDTNNVIDRYRLDYNITNPCAGPWGGGTTALTIIINGQNFLGFPTYCVICPDRTLYFDPCYPPTVSGFDPSFASCDTLTGINHINDATKSGIISVYPNPASTELSLEIAVKYPVPVTIEFFNLLGLKVFAASYDVYSGRQNININTDHLPNGVYFIRMMQNGQFIDTQKAWIAR